MHLRARIVWIQHMSSTKEPPIQDRLDHAYFTTAKVPITVRLVFPTIKGHTDPTAARLSAGSLSSHPPPSADYPFRTSLCYFPSFSFDTHPSADRCSDCYLAPAVLLCQQDGPSTVRCQRALPPWPPSGEGLIPARSCVKRIASPRQIAAVSFIL